MSMLRITAYPDRPGFTWAFTCTKPSGCATTYTFADGWRRDLLSMKEALPHAVREFRALRKGRRRWAAT